jgi:hypothetical protein
MRRMWSGRTIVALVILAASCASLRTPEESLAGRIAAVLERRGLGSDALLVIDNLLRHGPAAPRASPAVVLGVLVRPLDAANASDLFHRTVPELLTGFAQNAFPGKTSFEELLKTYLDELAEAQRMLRAASKPFEGDALLRQLAEGLPSPAELLGIADALDMAQLERANLLFIDATARFVSALRHAGELPSQPQNLQSAIGTVSIGTRGNDRHGPQAALIIDPGGDDIYERAPARGGAVSVIVDLGGNDEYRGSDLALHGLSAIVDLSGDERYAMDGPGLGAAIAGAALLVDFSGNDSYEAKFFAQGAAAFGIGALIDLAGNDRYRLEAWGQGFGLAQGLGLLWDRGGNDRYAAGGVPDAFNRGGGLSGAQGAAFGHRGRISGGIGILRDDLGDDLYEAQMFAQGLGYYYGLGLLWDLGGNDRYQAVRYAQGNGVHQAVGVLRDEAGDDRYAVSLDYGQGMALDLAVGVLVDGAGDDAYRARSVAQGAATANGFGLLADGGGADRWELAPDGQGWGRAEWARGLPSVGVLLHGNTVEFARGSNRLAMLPDWPAVHEAPRAPVCPPVTHAAPDPALSLGEALRRSMPAFFGERAGAAAYAEVRRRLTTGLRSSIAELSGEDFAAAWSFGEALRCALRDASAAGAAAMWRELQESLSEEPASPLAADIATALRVRPPPEAQAREIVALLEKHPGCVVRVLALLARPDPAAAQAGLRSGCWRLQAAARAAFARLGVPLPGDAALPSFLRGIPPQEGTF